MDLTKLYNLTTPELRAEAERLGVSDTYALSRAQLIHAIRSRLGAGPQEGLLGRVLGFAKWALQTTGAPDEAPPSTPNRDLDRQAAAEPSGPVDPPAENRPSSPVEPGRPDTKHFVRPSSAPSESVSPTAVSEPPSVSSARPSSSAGSSRAPAGVFSGASSPFEEPFPTRTMARILADQGHYKRSLAIYASLLHQAPDDAELRLEADEVRSQSRARRSHV